MMTLLMSVKMAVFAPMPSASERMATNAVAEIEPEVFRCRLPACRADVVLDCVGAAHLDACGAGGCFWRHAGALIGFGGGGEEAGQFFVHFAFYAGAAKQSTQTGGDIAEESHCFLPWS